MSLGLDIPMSWLKFAAFKLLLICDNIHDFAKTDNSMISTPGQKLTLINSWLDRREKDCLFFGEYSPGLGFINITNNFKNTLIEELKNLLPSNHKSYVDANYLNIAVNNSKPSIYQFIVEEFKKILIIRKNPYNFGNIDLNQLHGRSLQEIMDHIKSTRAPNLLGEGEAEQIADRICNDYILNKFPTSTYVRDNIDPILNDCYYSKYDQRPTNFVEYDNLFRLNNTIQNIDSTANEQDRDLISGSLTSFNPTDRYIIDIPTRKYSSGNVPSAPAYSIEIYKDPTDRIYKNIMTNQSIGEVVRLDLVNVTLQDCINNHNDGNNGCKMARYAIWNGRKCYKIRDDQARPCTEVEYTYLNQSQGRIIAQREDHFHTFYPYQISFLNREELSKGNCIINMILAGNVPMKQAAIEQIRRGVYSRSTSTVAAASGAGAGSAAAAAAGVAATVTATAAAVASGARSGSASGGETRKEEGQEMKRKMKRKMKI